MVCHMACDVMTYQILDTRDLKWEMLRLLKCSVTWDCI